MGQNDILEIIKSVVHKNLELCGSYKLFLFGQKIFEENYPYNFDIGIDCKFNLAVDKKVSIMNEIWSKVKSDKMWIVDFSNINAELKNRIYPNCQFIN